LPRFIYFSCVITQSPVPDPVTTVDWPDDPAVATVLLVFPSPERTVTEGPGPVVCPLTPSGPAVTELDIDEPLWELWSPVFFFSTTVQP